MKNIKSYFLLHIGVLIFALVTIPSKLAANENGLTFKFVFFLGLEFFLLGVYALLWQQILKNISLTVAYANKAVVIIWKMLIGVLLFKEAISINNIIGALFVVAGVVVMALGEKVHE